MLILLLNSTQMWIFSYIFCYLGDNFWCKNSDGLKFGRCGGQLPRMPLCLVVAVFTGHCAECGQVADVRAVCAWSNWTAEKLPLQEPRLWDTGLETQTRTRHGTAQRQPSKATAQVKSSSSDFYARQQIASRVLAIVEV